jgi:hypothetical protein
MAKIKKGLQGAITTAAHRARRIAREAARQAACVLTAGQRAARRKIGALRRIDRRVMDAANNAAAMERLQSIRIKVAAAVGGH